MSLNTPSTSAPTQRVSQLATERGTIKVPTTLTDGGGGVRMDVVSLVDGSPFDPKPILAGPWRWLRLATVEPGQAERLDPGEVEYTVYVMEGEGEAELVDRTVPIRAGS